MRLRKLLAFGLLPLAVAGCSSSEAVTQGTIGEMGEGVFMYACVDDGDAVCNETAAVDSQAVEVDLGIEGEMPSAVAVGARFDIHYSGSIFGDNGQSLLIDVVPARSDDVHNKGGFIITSPGSYAFLARSPKGIVGDFTQIEAIEASDLDIWKDEQRVTSFEAMVGAEVNLAVVPNDDVGISLAGALPYTWESSDDTVLVLGPVSGVGTPTGGVEINDDEIRIVALAEGQVVLTVARGDLTQEVTVTVTPEVTP